MNAPDTPAVELSADPPHSGDGGADIVTAAVAGEPVHTARVDLADPDALAAFVSAVCGGRGGVDPADVKRELLTLRREQADRRAADSRPVSLTETPETPGNGGGFRESAPAKAAPPAFVSFPLATLPPVVREFVTATADGIGCDPSYVVTPLLAVLAGAVGNARRVGLRDDYSEPCIVWTVTVGESGSAKSPAWAAAAGPVWDLQRAADRDFRDALADHERAEQRHALELAKWKGAGGGDDPPEAPVPPKMRTFYVGDTTPEALANVLKDNPRGALCLCDELAGWFGMMGRYTGGKGGGDAARWLELFHARPLRIDRKGGTPPVTFIPRASVSLTGTVQPGTLRRVLTEDHRESGLAARFLFAWPPPRVLRWNPDPSHPGPRAALRELVDSLYGLAMGADDDGEPVPVTLALTPSARAEWADRFNTNAAATAERTGAAAAAFSKAAAYAGRLALLVHLIREADGDATLERPAGGTGPGDPGAVDAASVAAGWELAEWYKREAERVLALLDEGDADTARRELAEWIGRNPRTGRPPGEITASELRRSRKHLFAGTGDAERALRDLAAAGFGRWESRPPGEAGGRPTDAFVLAGTGPPPPD